jgi:radical SAM protein with 4Fe4S-binding SPASM domain
LSIGRGTEGQHSLTPQEIVGFLNNTYFPLVRNYQRFLPEEQLGVDIGQALIPRDIKMSSGCGWVRGMAGMTSVGDMGLCHDIYDSPAFIAGNVRKDSIHHIWNTSPVFAKLRGIKPTQLKGICGNCRFNKSCRGKCRVHAVKCFGDIYAPDPVCQEYYNQGLFPQEALIDPYRLSSFG